MNTRFKKVSLLLGNAGTRCSGARSALPKALCVRWQNEGRSLAIASAADAAVSLTALCMGLEKALE